MPLPRQAFKKDLAIAILDMIHGESSPLRRRQSISPRLPRHRLFPVKPLDTFSR